jgi:ubiquinone/menaquinone biosynthesis C-methylase UbiE
LIESPHSSIEPTHYDEDASSYDAINEENSLTINRVLLNILKKHDVKTVLDLTCGTGSQVFFLTKHGYNVTGSDISLSMLNIAREKARNEQLDVKLIEGDLRSLYVNQFDAVITIFNAIGHLTNGDFEQAIQNIYLNLKVGGLYIFDIFNLEYLLHEDNITKLTIDWLKTYDGKKIRKIQYSTIDKEGILASFTSSITEIDNEKPKALQNEQTLQIYSASQIEEMLKRCGFHVLKQMDANGLKFIGNKSERILTVARKLTK